MSCGASFPVGREKTARPRMFRHFVPSRELHSLAPLKQLSPVDLPSSNGFDKPFAASKFEKKNRKLKQLDNLNLTKECECMKKLIALVLTLACVLALTGCGKNDTYKIKIVVPAGSTEEIVYQEDFVYSDEEISPIGNKITIYSGDGLGDTEVVLKPISVKEENAYEPTYLTPGMPVEMDVEKGAWFKVGINMQNNTDTDKIVYVEIEGVEVRIE